MFPNRRLRLLRWIAIAFTTLCLVLAISSLRLVVPIGLEPATAQLSRPQDAWQEVYRRLPDFPLENQYISKETGKVNPDNTLAGRFVRYHLYVKARPPGFRIDWKLTLADYLGVNDYLVAERYPGYDSLQQNPIEGDRAAIQKLNHAQRNALVDVLVSIFNPTGASNSNAPTPIPTPTPTPQPPVPNRPILPQPGDANLLR